MGVRPFFYCRVASIRWSRRLDSTANSGLAHKNKPLELFERLSMIKMFQQFRRTLRRRTVLNAHFNIKNPTEEVEESCVVSYSHSNPAVALAAWSRVMMAVRFWRRYARQGPILDFGAGTGEIHHFLDTGQSYHFIEADDSLAGALGSFVSGARRETLENLPPGTFACVMALDSLEHNDDVAAIVDRLVPALAPGGVLIVSGPTENALYRLARSIARFRDHFHKTTIYHIEAILAERFTRLEVHGVPLGLPLFRVSAWRL